MGGFNVGLSIVRVSFEENGVKRPVVGFYWGGDCENQESGQNIVNSN